MIMFWYRKPMMHGRIGFQDDVTANLMNAAVPEVLAKRIHELVAAKVAWEFHATAKTSSRTR